MNGNPVVETYMHKIGVKIACQIAETVELLGVEGYAPTRVFGGFVLLCPLARHRRLCPEMQS